MLCFMHNRQIVSVDKAAVEITTAKQEVRGDVIIVVRVHKRKSLSGWIGQ